MRIRRSIYFLALVVSFTLTLGACANIGKPNGGEKDTEGPEIIGTLPYPGTLFFDYSKVEFHFDEFLKPGSYNEDIFISPLPPSDPEIRVKNKTLTIKFTAPLRENTTYVISLGSGIADFNEGNKMEKSYTYAFSTGAVLDSMKFKGHVEDMWSGTGEADMKIMLFPADAIEENDIKGKRPEYLVSTDKEGNFEFNFLAPGRYKIYGVADANNDSKFSGASEKIALAANPLVVLNPQDSVPINLSMSAFFLDEKGLDVKSAKWSNAHTIHVELSEQYRHGLGSDSLRVTISDTNGGNTQAVSLLRTRYLDRKHLYLHAPVPRDRDYDLHFENLMDSLGHKSDTTIRLAQLSQVKEEKGKWFDQPVNLRRGHEFMVPAFFKLPEGVDSTMVQLVDTSGKHKDIEWRTQGMELYGKPSKLLKPNMEYQLRFRKSFPRPDGKPLDTLVVLKLMFPNPDDFGTIEGDILPDSAHPEQRFQVIFRGKSGTGTLVQAKSAAKENGKGKNTESLGPDHYEERFMGPGPYKFVYLHPGEYNFDIVEDLDGNGVLTPGSLVPYKMPEKVYHQATPMEVKAKWDMEDVEIYPIPKAGKGGKGGDALKGAEIKSDKGGTSDTPKGGGKGKSPKGK